MGAAGTDQSAASSRGATARAAGTDRPGATALLGAIIELSEEAIVLCDQWGRVSTWGATAQRLFGCPADEIVGAPLEQLVAEHLRREAGSVVAAALAGDGVRNFETEILRPDGMPVPVSMSIWPLANDDGGDLSLLVIGRDITEQRVTQATLAEVETRLEEGEALAHVGSWLWDLRTGAVQWSAEFHRIHGVDPLQFDGTLLSHLSVIHESDRPAVKEAMERSAATGQPFETEYRVVRPDANERRVHVRARPTIGSAGSAVGLRGIGQDVTERAPGLTSSRRGT